METYQIFAKSSNIEETAIEVIPEGYSHFAIVFGPIWALKHNLYLDWLISSIIIVVAARYHSQFLGLTFWLITGILLFFAGADRRAAKLNSQEYSLKDRIQGFNENDAFSIYKAKVKKQNIKNNKEKVTDNIKKSDEDNDYISQLEKAKKLRDDGDINIDDYEILKQDIMNKVPRQ